MKIVYAFFKSSFMCGKVATCGLNFLGTVEMLHFQTARQLSA